MARRVVHINGCAHDRADRPDLLSQGGVEGSNLVGQSVSDGTPIAQNDPEFINDGEASR